MSRGKRRMKFKNIKILGAIVVFVVAIFFLVFNINKKVVMIDLSNYTLEEIKSFIDNKDIKLNIEYEYNDDIEEGKLISQSIPEGTTIDKEKKLTVTISLGLTPLTLYKNYKVNELGYVPIMMYHGIINMKSEDTLYTGGNYDRDGYHRTTEAFIKDLEMYYDKGYRMIRLNDYINGNIDVEIGKSPIILTFDDGHVNNFNVLGRDKDDNLIIDPNSAVGILESFKEKYPDFNVTATFFLNGGLFRQTEYNNEILSWLVDNGYDIGNHTRNHINIKEANEELIMSDIAYMYQLYDKIIPSQHVNIIALPFGVPFNKEHTNFKYVLEGSCEGYEYKTDSTLKVGSTPNYSPYHIKYDKTFISRVRAWDNNGKEFDIEMTFNNLEKNRYISSGNKKIIVIPSNEKDNITNNIDKEIVIYEVD